MSIWKTIPQHWRQLSITTKFISAFGLLLALIVLVAITSYITLTTVRRHLETTILTSAEIQRLTLEMNGEMEEAHRHERDFFLRYPAIGFLEARQIFVPQVKEHLTRAVTLRTELQRLISESEVSDALRASDVNLNLYLSTADRYAVSFDRAVVLVAQLATPKTGLEAQIRRRSALLLDILQTADDPNLVILYRQMQSFEKDYWLTRQRPLMQSAFNTAHLLQEAIEFIPTLEADQKTQALAHLENYLSTAEEILELDVAIRSKFNEFNLQTEAVDPISKELIFLANEEVKRARAQIEQASRVEMGVLVATTVAGLMLVGIIAWVLNSSITQNVLKLTQVAGELQAGDLKKRIQIDSGDELGQLADSFNAMAARINALVDNLEQRVAERTTDLVIVNEQLKQEIVERNRVEDQLKASLAEKEILVREIHHRVKNNLQSLIYLIDMQVEKIDDSQSLDTLNTLQGRIEAMSLVHQKLYQAGNLAQINFGDYLEDLAEHLLYALAGGRDIALHVEAQNLFIGVDVATPCGLIVNELVTNALKYAFPEELTINPPLSSKKEGGKHVSPSIENTREACEIRVGFQAWEDKYILTVADNGVGLPPDLDWRATKSLGLRLVNLWATHQLGGNLEVDTRSGTTFTIKV